MKKLAVLTLAVVSCLSVAIAKTYQITVTSATKAGSVQLKAGQYRLKVEGTNATFIDVKTSKEFTTPIKVETTEKKFDQTLVDSTQENGTNVIMNIGLGGSKTRIGFGL